MKEFPPENYQISSNYSWLLSNVKSADSRFEISTAIALATFGVLSNLISDISLPKLDEHSNNAQKNE